MPDTQRGAQQNAGHQNTGHQNPGTPSSGEVKGQVKQAVGQVQDTAKQVAGQAREAAQPVVNQAKQGAEHLAEQAKDQFATAREGALKGYRQAEGTIARNPAPAMLIGFGVGFGLGVVLCSLLGKKEETWSEKYLPESLQNVPDQYQSLIASLKGLPKAVHQQLPKSVSQYLG